MTRRSVFMVVLLGLASLGAGGKDTVVADAAEKRDAKAVQTLVKRGADPSGPQPDGATALHWATHWNDLETARFLVASRANPNAANDYGVVPLYLAATNGSVDMLHLLLAHGASPNVVLPSGETALMAAVRSGSTAAVKRLLEGGADPNAAQASKGQTALMWAATNLHLEIARLLIEKGVNVNAQSLSGFTALMFAARSGGIEITRLLLEAGAQLEASARDGTTPLLVATVRGHVPFALFLLERGAKPDGNFERVGYAPLHWAVFTMEVTQITYPEQEPPGEWAALGGIPDRAAKLALIKELLARGANVNARSTKEMPVLASIGGQQDGYQTPKVGATPFYNAAASGDVEIMRLLLAHGADAKIRAGDGMTPLMAAAAGNIDILVDVTEKQRIEAIALAREAGDHIEDQDERGYRAMHHAARSGFHEVIKHLLAQGADMNPLSKPRYNRGGLADGHLEAQSPLGLVEGTLGVTLYEERPETAALLRSLGAKSVGRFVGHKD